MLALPFWLLGCGTTPPQPSVPTVTRTAGQPTCWASADGARLQLDLGGGPTVSGTWTAPGGGPAPLQGQREGRLLRLNAGTAEIEGATVAWEGQGGPRQLHRVDCDAAPATAGAELGAADPGAATEPPIADPQLAAGRPDAQDPAATPGDLRALREICDASAAVRWRGRRLVADDETNVLRVYRPGADTPEQRIDLTGRVPGLGGGEADFEGMALDGDRLWLIGSHDSGKKKKPDPSRSLLLALDLREQGGQIEATVVDAWRGLRDRMAADPRWAPVIDGSAGLTSKSVAGFSVEGLALDPAGAHTGGAPGLLIGLRAPVIEGQALVLPLIPGPDGARTWTLGEPVRLDLGGSGIRSLERTAAGWRGIAGAPTSGGAFGLFQWADSGSLTRAPGPAGLSPEALWEEDGAWWVLSDDGNEKVGGLSCKKAPEAVRSARIARLP